MKIIIILTALKFIITNVNSQITSKRSMELAGGLSHYLNNSDNVINEPNSNVSFYLSKYKNKRWKYSAGISYMSALFEYKIYIGWSFTGIRYNKLKYAQIPVMISRRFFFGSNHNLNIATGVYLSRLLEWSEGDIVNGTQTSVTYLKNANHTALGIRFSPGYSYQISKRIKLHAIGSVNYKIGRTSIQSFSDSEVFFASLDDRFSLSLNIGMEVFFRE